MSLVLSGSIFNAILNVLAIIVLALTAGFIVVLLVDLTLGCIDGKRGVIFFRNRKNTDKDNEILLQYNKDISLNDRYYLQNNEKNLVLDFDKEYENQNAETKNNNIDFNKAAEEQKLLEAKNAKLEEKTPVTEVNEDFTFINKVSPEIEKEIEEEKKPKEEKPEPKIELNEKDEDDDFDFLDDEDDDDKSIEEILRAIKEKNMRARNQFVKDEDLEPDFDEDEVITTPEEKTEELKEEKKDVEEVIENTEPTSQNNEELEKLKAMVEELNGKLDEEQKKNAELEEKAKLEVENLKKELEEKSQPQEEITVDTLKGLEEELAKLLERQKQNDKDLKINKKEYIPLARIARTLESDQDKLRRREAIVAKKKMVILGVNNVADPEKQQKLDEEIELLNGLRTSVAHCSEVMEANKDRYPVLRRTNEILTRNAQDLENDINDVQAKIAHAKEVLNNNGTDGDASDNSTNDGTQE